MEPYPNHYELYSQASGIQTVHVSTRERPKLIFDSKGEISHLVTGTCEARTCPYTTRQLQVLCELRTF